jgi:hypothetical protein
MGRAGGAPSSDVAGREAVEFAVATAEGDTVVGRASGVERP